MPGVPSLGEAPGNGEVGRALWPATTPVSCFEADSVDVAAADSDSRFRMATLEDVGRGVVGVVASSWCSIV